MSLVWLAGRFLVFTLLMQIPTSSYAQQISQPAKTRAIPTLEALPHVSLSKGAFAGWCGQKDRYLLKVDGQFEAFDAGVKIATIAVWSEWKWQCRNDGEQLIYLDSRMGYVTAVDIASGDSRLLASYSPKPGITLAFSPDFKSVATSDPLKLTADAPGLKVIDVSHQDPVEQFGWSSDGTMFYGAYRTELKIFDARGKKLSAAKRQPSEIVDGWFIRGNRILTLFLTRSQLQDVGSAIRCPLASGNCVSLRSRVESLSIGGREIMGVVEPLDKPTPYVDASRTIYDHYRAEVSHPKAGLLARQTFRTAVDRRWDYAISISPSGTRAILTWDDHVQCKSAVGSYGCARGILLNLPEVNE